MFRFLDACRNGPARAERSSSEWGISMVSLGKLGLRTVQTSYSWLASGASSGCLHRILGSPAATKSSTFNNVPRNQCCILSLRDSGNKRNAFLGEA